MSIKIARPDFCDFIKLCTLSGNIENLDCAIEFKSDQVLSLIKTDHLIVRGILFGKFEEWGQLGIDNLILLRNYCNSLNTNNINISKTENKLSFKSEKSKFSSVLRNINYIKNLISNDRFQKGADLFKGGLFELSFEDIREIISQYKVLKPDSIRFISHGKTLTLKIENYQNELTYELDSVPNTEFNIEAPSFLIDILNMFSDKVSISFETNKPIYIYFKKQSLQMEYIISPIVK